MVSRPSLRAIVFDLDGTLIDSAPDIAAAVNTVLAESGRPELSLDDVRDTIRVGLLRKKSEAELARYLEELEQTYPVTLHREHLSFAFLEHGGGAAMGTTEDSP